MKNGALHILFLARWYPNKEDPMFGLFVRRHAEAAALFQQVSVVYVHAVSKAESKFEVKQSAALKEYIVYYRKPENKGVIGKIISFQRFWKANIRAIKMVEADQPKVDLIHVHVLSRLGLLGWVLAFRRGIPFMITEHWSRYLPVNNDFNGFFRKGITRFVVKRAAGVTAVTKNLAQAMQAHGLNNKNYHILPNVVNMHLFKPGEEKPSSGKIQLVHLSCFEDKSKNISGLLRVLASLKEQAQNFECTLIGDGIDFESLKNYASDLGLSSQLRFTGLLEGEKLADELAKADFMVMFSNYENMPVVILEAFACGLPVVATRVGGIPEMVNDQNGLLVSPKNEGEMLAAITWMMENYTNFDPAMLRAMVEDKYSLEAVGKLLHSWYTAAIKAP
ncbi:MAG: glycosyltransferase [Bacteroidetes bacterium]|nr:glycosyltransferase [Bacteroidota bacterium]